MGVALAKVEDVRRAKAEPTVLVVEDEALVRISIVDHLLGNGFRVIEAATADEACAVLSHAGVAVDIVFCDVATPGKLNGFGLAGWVRKSRPDVKVLLTSGVDRAAGVAADLLETQPFLQKPYRPSSAAKAIRELLAKPA